MTELIFHRELNYAYLAIAAAVFVTLFFIPAAYGRHSRAGWGPQISTRLSWMIMESVSLLTFAAFLILGAHHSPAELLLGALWLGHYFHRAILFPLRMKMSARPTPLVICLMAVIFNLGNAYLNSRWLYTLSPGYPDAWLRDPRFLGGIALFVIGFAINYRADRTLAGLRKGSDGGYQIPRGGLYELISCPNYFGEMLEWSGFALAAWSLPGLTFALWTAANLAPRAITHHRWYRETFPDYPRRRRALIPFVI